MIWREDDNQIRREVAECGEGIRGNCARIDMSRMRGNDGDDVSVEFGELDGVEIFIHAGGEGFGVALVPSARNRGRAKVKHKIIVA